MRLLLDTHIFLWFATGHSRLSAVHRSVIEDRTNELFLSVVSVWEATVKYRLGKLQRPSAAPGFFIDNRKQLEIASLTFTEACISFLPGLPPVHKDPFDRMLVCPCKAFGLTLVTEDATLRAYGIPTL